MKSQTTALISLVALLPLVSCGAEAAPAPTSRPNATNAAATAAFDPADLQAVWPETGSKVYEDFDVVIGVEGTVIPGRIALVTGGPVAEGQKVVGQMLPDGANSGTVTFPVGKHDVTVQLVDADGKSRGPSMAHTVSWQVVAKPSAQRVFFVEPKDGATVSSPVHVVFGVEGMGMSKALENQLDKTVGHHHVIIDQGVISPSMVIPKDGIHIHYGDAQTEANLELQPGEYTLTMQFADGNHRSYGKRLSSSIKIKVE